MNKLHRLPGLSLGCLLTFGCSSVPKPKPDDLPRARAVWPGVSLTELQTERNFYLRKCGSCHSAKAPARFPAAKRERVLDKMGPKAKLAPGEKERILRFLAAMTP